MASEKPETNAPSGAEPSSPTTFSLQIVSPSSGVPGGNLKFARVPANTTIRELKERIRDTLESTPSDQQQRIIHQGRMLARDDETLLDVFGANAVWNPLHT